MKFEITSVRNQWPGFWVRVVLLSSCNGGKGTKWKAVNHDVREITAGSCGFSFTMSAIRSPDAIRWTSARKGGSCGWGPSQASSRKRLAWLCLEGLLDHKAKQDCAAEHTTTGSLCARAPQFHHVSGHKTKGLPHTTYQYQYQSSYLFCQLPRQLIWKEQTKNIVSSCILLVRCPISHTLLTPDCWQNNNNIN